MRALLTPKGRRLTRTSKAASKRNGKDARDLESVRERRLAGIRQEVLLQFNQTLLFATEEAGALSK
jgi:hypothetical protein